LVLTAVHHLYGAEIYGTPWRAHIVHPAMAALVVILAGLYLSHRYRGTRVGQVSRWIAIGVTVLIPVAWIGLFEGGYNHVVKNILYFAGASAASMKTLFPPPTYEMPDNWVFEITGVLQFVLALVLGKHTRQLASRTRRIALSDGE